MKKTTRVYTDKHPLGRAIVTVLYWLTWGALGALALWILFATAFSFGNRKTWQPNPEIGHRAAHKSGNPPPYNK
jgi:hypothetical protein